MSIQYDQVVKIKVGQLIHALKQIKLQLESKKVLSHSEYRQIIEDIDLVLSGSFIKSSVKLYLEYTRLKETLIQMCSCDLKMGYICAYHRVRR